MNVVGPELLQGASHGRVVWSGRWRDAVVGGLDGWSHGRTDLYLLLDVASELVVLDPLSFPWESLRDSDRDIPLVVVLPSELDTETLPLVLGQPLLRHLTPADRLVEARPDVRAMLERDWAVGPAQWLEPRDASRDAALAVLEEHSATRLTTVSTAFGDLVAQSGDLITRHLVEHGAHQRGSLNALLALLREGDVVIDVGAHIGTIAIPVARTVGDTGRVLALEAHGPTAALLQRNVSTNGLDHVITVRDVVVGAVDGRWQVPHIVGGNTGATSFRVRPRRSPNASITRSLDAFLAEADSFDASAVDLLKIDVEGAEMAVLEGAEAVVATAAPVLFIEVSTSQLSQAGSSIGALDTWLRARGHHLFAVTGTRNFAGSEWALTAIESLSEVDEVLFDVVAIPPDSPRLAAATEAARR